MGRLLGRNLTEMSNSSDKIIDRIYFCKMRNLCYGRWTSKNLAQIVYVDRVFNY